MRAGAVALLALAIAAPASAEACSNDSFRLGPSASLGECRAYEMVSPADKRGGSVYAQAAPQAAPSGEAIEFFSNSSFADAPASVIAGAYLAKRGTNWATESLGAPLESVGDQIRLPSPASSPDLSRTLQISDLALTPGAVEGGSNVYLRDNATGARTLLLSQADRELFVAAVRPETSEFLVVGGTSDWSHILISSTFPLTPEAPEPEFGVSNLYEWSGNGLRLVNYVPDESGGEVLAPGASVNSETPYAHSMSADGSRIFFVDGSRLYMRLDGTRTVPISVSRRAGEEGLVKEGINPVADAAGNVVYFTGNDPLTEEPPGTGSDLYRYGVESGTLTDLTPNELPEGAGVGIPFAGTEDGSTLYFGSTEVLAPGATQGAPGSDVNFYVVRGDEVRFIAHTAPGDGETRPIASQTSSNGRFYAFSSLSPLTAEDVAGPSCLPTGYQPRNEGDCSDVYLYDAVSGKLKCLSCDGQAPLGDSSLGGQVIRSEPARGHEPPRSVLDDGTVFFNSPNALVGRDVNGVDDVYGARPSGIQLYSSGLAESGSAFAGATADARDVFFTTTQPLVPQDVDQVNDLYDARVEGGLASQRPAPSAASCQNEGCLGAAPGPPAGLAPASETGSGSVCAAQSAAAVAARKRGAALARQAKAVSRRAGSHAHARARKLRRRVVKQRRSARKLQKTLTACRDAGR